MIIDNTNKPKRIIGINNLTPGVYRMISHRLMDTGCLMYCTPEPRYATVNGNIGQILNGRRCRLFVVEPNGNIWCPGSDLGWDYMEFEFVSKTMDFVVPGQDG